MKKEVEQFKTQQSNTPKVSQSVTANKVTFAQLAQSMKNQNSDKPMPKHERHKRTITFKPQKNIVVAVEREGDIVKNDDDIRKALDGLDSDIIIERISRSSNNCFKKFCAQFS